jgi:Fe-S oxidoreductase
MMDNMTSSVQTMAEMNKNGLSPEILFWVGCAGSFDDRSKKITKAFVELLHKANVSFAVLGPEESCTGDPAKRAGNEFLFQMQASTNIEVLNGYQVKKIVTACPHCFNTLKNEYPQLGGQYEVLHHTQFLNHLIESGRLSIDSKTEYKGKKITFHDPCYLGRANNEYEAPRTLIKKLKAELIEMKSCKEKGLCCGAGGAQMFKDSEKGDKEINIERTEEALDANPEIIAAGCPFCNTMLQDGVTSKGKESKVAVLDIAQLLAKTESL